MYNPANQTKLESLDSSNKQIQGQIRTGQTNNNTNGRTTSKCIYKYGHQGSGQSGGNVSKKSKCEYCGKIVHSSYLLNHKRIHIGKKPFVCGWENCGKSFALPNYLLIHKRSHTGRKPFVCDWRNCGKGFNGSTDLKIHKRSHTGEKPFICNWEECRKRFSAKRYLVCHKLTHTRKKTYKCDVQGCEIVFRRKRGFLKHKIIHAGENPFNCIYCSLTFISKESFDDHVRHHTISV